GVDSSLNETGRQQAAAFHRYYREQRRFDATYVSRLVRTHQTMAPWTEQDQYDLIPNQGLNEFSWGVHEGVAPTAEQKADFQDILQAWSGGELERRVPQGETPVEAWDRAKDFFQTIIQRHQDQHVLLCSHGRQLRVILSNLIDGDMVHMEKYKHHNTGFTVLELHPGGIPELKLLNDVRHLEKQGIAV
ncbi:MAG: histidine phosphatase family protein, partial [Bacteroidota bacterium]